MISEFLSLRLQSFEIFSFKTFMFAVTRFSTLSFTSLNFSNFKIGEKVKDSYLFVNEQIGKTKSSFIAIQGVS